MDPYEVLANAIIVRAVDDYRSRSDPDAVKEIERFFLSEWFRVLSKADGNKILCKLREEKET